MRTPNRARKNLDIRADIMRAGLREWEVGARLGMSAAMFSYMLKKELTVADRDKVMQAIADTKREIWGE